jgi:hypothetical protein
MFSLYNIYYSLEVCVQDNEMKKDPQFENTDWRKKVKKG